MNPQILAAQCPGIASKTLRYIAGSLRTTRVFWGIAYVAYATLYANGYAC